MVREDRVDHVAPPKRSHVQLYGVADPPSRRIPVHVVATVVPVERPTVPRREPIALEIHGRISPELARANARAWAAWIGLDPYGPDRIGSAPLGPSSPPALPQAVPSPGSCLDGPAAASSVTARTAKTPSPQSQRSPKKMGRRSRTSDHVRPCAPVEDGAVVTHRAASLT